MTGFTFVSSRKMTKREQDAYDMGYEIGKREAVKHGRWIAERDRMGNYSHCSECGCRCQGYAPNYKYCPNCGAKMDKEVNHDR